MNKELGYDIAIGAGHDVLPFEKACGRGSFPMYNKEYTKTLLDTLHGLSDVKTIADYGCGNLESYKGHIDWTKEPYEYIGYDAHRNLIKDLRKRYPELTFKEVELNTLPEPADVLIIKDVLIHWFDDEIKDFFDKVFDSFKYVIYMHDTSEQSYTPRRNKRCPPDGGYGVKELMDKNLYGYRHVPYELLPADKILFKKDMMADSMKTFILFGDKE